MSGEQFPYEILEIITEYCDTPDIPSFITAICEENDKRMVTRYIRYFMKKRREDDMKRMWEEELKKQKANLEEDEKENEGKKIQFPYRESLLSGESKNYNGYNSTGYGGYTGFAPF